ncbi:hypothetical protein L3V31_21415 [Vibrio sp. J1-1]|nr:hypothetical protein [Vibrio sp. J1-1]
MIKVICRGFGVALLTP